MCQMCINMEKKEAFAERIVGMMNDAALTMMISLGHRTGLYDTMAELPPSTSDEIARAAHLDERYVREWLNAMVVGLIVDYSPENKTYFLPPEHAAWLTRAATPNNLAVFTQYIGQMGAVEDRIVESFHNGGGVRYEEFKRFHEIMAEDSGQTVVPELIDSILPLAPGLVDRLKQGMDVLDLGCGRGWAMNLLAKAFPESRFAGYDFSREAIDLADRQAQRNNSDNVRFEVQDAAKLNAVEAFDLIFTFDAIHDQAEPQKVLNNIHRALRPGGVYLMQDIHSSRDVEKNVDNPMAPLLYTVSTFHCMTVSLALGGAGLGTMWGEETALEMLAVAGFENIERHRLEHDIQNTFFIMRK